MVEQVGPPRRPVSLTGAVVLVGLEGLALVVFGLLELTQLAADRVALGLSTTLFFVLAGAGLLACARGLAAVRSWARAPVVAAQLIWLLTASSFWGGDTTLAAVALGLVGLATLVCVLHPASTRALAADPY